MNRYDFIPTIKTDNGKTRYASLIIPNIPEDITLDTYIRTTSIDRLDKISLYFYNDATMWVVIAAANNLGKGTIVVPPNTRLRIPNQANITSLITKTNTR